MRSSSRRWPSAFLRQASGQAREATSNQLDDPPLRIGMRFDVALSSRERRMSGQQLHFACYCRPVNVLSSRRGTFALIQPIYELMASAVKEQGGKPLRSTSSVRAHFITQRFLA